MLMPDGFAPSLFSRYLPAISSGVFFTMLVVGLACRTERYNLQRRLPLAADTDHFASKSTTGEHAGGLPSAPSSPRAVRGPRTRGINPELRSANITLTATCERPAPSPRAGEATRSTMVQQSRGCGSDCLLYLLDFLSRESPPVIRERSVRFSRPYLVRPGAHRTAYLR